MSCWKTSAADLLGWPCCSLSGAPKASERPGCTAPAEAPSSSAATAAARGHGVSTPHPAPCLTGATGDVQPRVIRKLHGVSFPNSLPVRSSLGLCLTATGEAARWHFELVLDLSVLRLVSHVQAKLVGQNQAGLELPGPCHSSCSHFTARQQHCSGSVLLPPGLDPRFPA